MAAKHIISISNMVANKVDYDESIWDEKLGDAINYLCLLKVVIKEDQKNCIINIKGELYIIMNKVNMYLLLNL